LGLSAFGLVSLNGFSLICLQISSSADFGATDGLVGERSPAMELAMTMVEEDEERGFFSFF
jgi:hypothetical protein